MEKQDARNSHQRGRGVFRVIYKLLVPASDGMSTEQLVETARYYLEKNPFDAVHDVRHHAAVWDNCLWIIREEGIPNLNLDVLKVAAWWHDVQRGQDDEISLLREKMQEFNMPNETRTAIFETVGSHSFGNTQASTEAKILYDADKMEYASFERVKILLKMRAEEKISEADYNHYVKTWRERIVSVKGQMHFESSKKEFEKRLTALIEMAENNKELKVFTEGIVL